MSASKPLIVIGMTEEYLGCTDVVDFDDPSVISLASGIGGGTDVDVLRRAFETVRDRFPHSRDISSDEVPFSASDVIRTGHGLCYAKSHLLAALLRHNDIPAGFCYQRLKEDDGIFLLHCFNAAYVDGRWVRIDARGNNESVHVDFDLDADMRAIKTDETLGEKDYPVVFPRPDPGVIRALGSTDSLSRMTLPCDLSCPLE
jgi:transglutaminase-like putative cysteine protease